MVKIMFQRNKGSGNKGNGGGGGGKGRLQVSNVNIPTRGRQRGDSAGEEDEEDLCQVRTDSEGGQETRVTRVTRALCRCA